MFVANGGLVAIWFLIVIACDAVEWYCDTHPRDPYLVAAEAEVARMFPEDPGA